MVSLQMGGFLKNTTLSNSNQLFQFHKRKREERVEENWGKDFKNLKSEKIDSAVDVELHLEQPLPLDWQRCLDIQSGEIHFYNTRTHKRTSRDPRLNSMNTENESLDLELNLSYNGMKSKTKNSSLIKNFGFMESSPLQNSKEDCSEMVAAICMKCHMLVMLYKSSPTCPHCKFLNPQRQNLSSTFNPGFRRLLCCKD